MYIYQPDRDLLKKQIKKYSHYIKGKVLDVGAGSYSRYINLFHYDQYIKMDIQAGENIDVVGRAEDIPFEDESFDSVVCTQVFEHLSEPFKAVNEIYRVLKKGGYLLLTVPQVNELHEEPNDYFRYTKYGIEEVFKKAGFKIIEMEQRGGYHSVIAQLKIRYLIDKYNLYKRPILGRLANKFFSLYGHFMIWLDSMEMGKYNRKHAIGWCFVFLK